MRPLDELLDARDPAWPVVTDMVAKATHAVEILPVRREHGARTLVDLQVTTRSPMGAIAYETGGLLVDRGWLRILGSGHPRLPRDLARWNTPFADRTRARLAGAFLVADDVLGGFFAINGGGLRGPERHVFYLAPDSLEWEDLGRGYTDFLQFAFAGDLAHFYADQRWSGWEREVEKLAGDRAFHFYPMLCTDSLGGIESRSRKDVPIEELWGLHSHALPAAMRGADEA
jgi:hypothetical protein